MIGTVKRSNLHSILNCADHETPYAPNDRQCRGYDGTVERLFDLNCADRETV
jgi:hypothetical protein